MTQESQKKEGMNITVNGNVGAIGGTGDKTGDKQKVKGSVKVTLKESEKQDIAELQRHLKTLMTYVENYKDAEFKEIASAHTELQEIDDGLTDLESATPETKGKVLQLLNNIKDSSLSAIQLGNKIKDAEETVTRILELSMTVAPIISSLSF